MDSLLSRTGAFVVMILPGLVNDIRKCMVVSLKLVNLK